MEGGEEMGPDQEGKRWGFDSYCTMLCTSFVERNVRKYGGRFVTILYFAM